VTTPALLPAAARLYARWEPFQDVDAEQGYPLAYLAEAMCVANEIADILARDSDTHEAWHIIFDPNACPAYVLPWLALAIGVRLLPSDTEAVARARIAAAAGWRRGTRQAIVEEAQPTLTGTKTVRVTKVGAWEIAVLVRTSETPDAAATELAVRRQKPAAVILDFIVSDDVIWAEAGAAVAWDDVDPTVTWDAVELADVS
jgi:phage tail P2-like protein